MIQHHAQAWPRCSLSWREVVRGPDFGRVLLLRLMGQEEPVIAMSDDPIVSSATRTHWQLDLARIV